MRIAGGIDEDTDSLARVVDALTSVPPRRPGRAGVDAGDAAGLANAEQSGDVAVWQSELRDDINVGAAIEAEISAPGVTEKPGTWPSSLMPVATVETAPPDPGHLRLVP